jgi:hypothetical protein
MVEAVLWCSFGSVKSANMFKIEKNSAHWIRDIAPQANQYVTFCCLAELLSVTF